MEDIFFPLPVPSDPPDVGVFFYPAFGSQWLPVIIGKLQELKDVELWDDPPSDLIGQIDELLERLSVDNSERLPRVIGEITMFSFYPPPAGWVKCEGQLLLIADYPDLYAVIGTAYGSGGGGTQFRVPDLVRRSPFGTNAGGSQMGTKEGAENHTLSVSELPAHHHPPSSPETVFRAAHAGGSSGYATVNASQTIAQIANTGDTGSGAAHNNLHPVFHLVFGIYAGVT